jgi:hypothetical protein
MTAAIGLHRLSGSARRFARLAIERDPRGSCRPRPIHRHTIGAYRRAQCVRQRRIARFVERKQPRHRIILVIGAEETTSPRSSVRRITGAAPESAMPIRPRFGA